MTPPSDSSPSPGVMGATSPHATPRDPFGPAADATAMSLVGLLFFCVVCFAWGATVLSRREKEVLAHEEAERAAKRKDEIPETSSEMKRAPWERDGDWWRK